jgi:HAD superfamily hydrolase (TIGR01509 family)
MKGVIFDLDQTIIDSSISEYYRNNRKWSKVYELIPNFTVYNEINEILIDLRVRDFKIAIVTTSPSTYTDKVLNHFNIECDFRVCYHDAARIKPYPDQYNKVVENLQLHRDKTYTLGDRAIDIQAAHNANIISCACYWGTKEKNLLDNSQPNHKFLSVAQAREFFHNK